MKQEDLVIGKKYLVFVKKKINVCGQFSDLPFIGTFKERCGTALIFSVVCEDTDLDSPTFGSEFNSDFHIEEKDIKKIEEYSEEEKTMQDQFKLKVEPLKKCKKPFRKILKLSEQDTLKFLSEQGYNTEGYTVGDCWINETADIYITLNLVECENENTKTN